MSKKEKTLPGITGINAGGIIGAGSTGTLGPNKARR